MPHRLLRAARAFTVLLCSLLLLPGTAHAQSPDDVPRATRTVAFTNARVVQAPGRVLDRATVLVRDGLILNVGADLPLPFDARIIEADSLTIYAGLISGLSEAGVEEPEQGEESEEVERPGDPPYDIAGIQPDRLAARLLDPGDSDIQKLREAGFTVAHVVPEGDMLPGQGTVILLAGTDASEMVLLEAPSLFAQFDGASGVYPQTDMAVIAAMRQLVREARRQQTARARYADNPTGIGRAPFDPVHQALFPVLDGEQPVFFQTESALDTYRALALAEELDLPLVLAGLPNAALTVDALREADVPLLLTLDLPEAEDEEEDPDTSAVDPTAADAPYVPDDSLTTAADSAKVITPEAPGSFFVRDFRTRSYRDVEDETDNLKARKALAVADYEGAAAALHEAGLAFGFSTLDVKPADIWPNVRRMIAAGLPEDAALAALTTQPAATLGLSRTLGTVEPGRIANLVVTDGPLFDVDRKIRFVLVDGAVFEVDAQTEPGEPPALNPVGTWAYEVDTPDGTFAGVLTLTGEPADLEGTITNEAMPGGSAQLDDLVLDGSTLTFNFDGGQSGRISVSVELDGDDLDGTLTVPRLGAVPMTGSRTAGPDRR